MTRTLAGLASSSFMSFPFFGLGRKALLRVLLFGLAVVATIAGYSTALGAFLLGTIVAETPHRHQVERTFEGMRDVFSALRKDNWLHLQKKPERSLFESIKREVRAAFYPDTADWKRKVWQHAIETFEPALAAIA